MLRAIPLLVAALLFTGCFTPILVPIPVPVEKAGSPAIATAESPAAATVDASQPAPTSTSDASAASGFGTVNDPEVLAQLTNARAACSGDKTSAQQQAALDEVLPFFIDREVQLTGSVNDVRDLNGKFDVIVSLDAIDRDILIDEISKEQALALNKGDAVLLTGKLDLPYCVMYAKLFGTVTKQ